MRQESTIRSIKLVAIDLAKRCYQLGAIDEQGKILYKKGHRTCFKLAIGLCRRSERSSTRGFRAGRFAAHHGAQQRITLHHDAGYDQRKSPCGICPSTASVHSSTLDGEEASIYVQ